jgi:tetratricopeptide (TPR) repeat protein
MHMRILMPVLLLLGMAACSGTVPQATLDALAQRPAAERIPELEAMASAHPGDQRLTLMLGRAMWESYENLDSRARVESIKADLRADPENAILSKLLGDAFSDLAKSEDGKVYQDSALFAYENAALKEPLYLAAVGSVGALYDEMEDFDQAVLWYEKALAIEPGHVPTLCNLGASFYNKGDYPKAVDCYREALVIDPLSQDARYNLGVAFAEASIYGEAVAEWDRVVAIDSTTAVAKQAKTNADLLRDIVKDTVYKSGRKSRRLFNDPSEIRRTISTTPRAQETAADSLQKTPLSQDED